jgi:hypothetical protein
MTFLFNIQFCILLLLCTSFSFGAAPKDTLYNFSCSEDHSVLLNDVTCHLLHKKQWSFAYTFTNIGRGDNRVGGAKISDEKLFENYMMVPNQMSMHMHMLMLMYGLTDKLTLMAMLQYVSNSMIMNMPPPVAMSSMPGMNMGTAVYGGPVGQYSASFGDSRITALYQLLDRNRNKLFLNAGLSLPTGSVSETGPTMSGANNKMPYNMQTGTGTFCLLPSITYLNQKNAFSFGFNAGSNIKLGTNSEGYAFGNTYFAAAGAGYSWKQWINNSIRIEAVKTNQIRGYDKDVAVLMNNDPNSNSLHYGGNWLNLYLGMDLFTKLGSAHDNRFRIEYGIPIWQNINGPQLSILSFLSIGWYHTIN